MNGRKRIGLIALIGLVAILIVYGFMPRPTRVSSAEAYEGPLEVLLEEEGRTIVKERFTVTAPLAGVVERLPFEVGDKVSEDQLLVRLASVPSQALDPRSHAQATARAAAAEAALQASGETIQAAVTDSSLTADEYRRVEGLFEAGSATQQMLDQARATLERARAQLRSATLARDVARHERDAARTALRYSGQTQALAQPIAVHAPVGGCILRVYQKDAGLVAAGQPLLDLGDPNDLEIVVDVLSEDAVRIHPGMAVRFERWGGPETLKGEVRLIEPVGFTKISALGVEEQRVLTRIDFASPSDQWRRLGDGYRLQAQFILWEHDRVLQIPTSALFRVDQDWAVFVVQNSRARVHPVEIGQRSGLSVQVLDGLSAGDVVITHPQETLEDGARVRLR